MLRTAEAKYDEAWQDLLACHRLGRHVGRATLIHALVGIAIDAIAARADIAFLASAKLSSEQVQRYLTDLHKLPRMPSISGALDVGERIIYLDSLQHIRLGTDATPEERVNLAKIDWQPAITNGMKFYDRMVAASRLPTRAARERAFDGIEKELEAMVKETKKDQNPLQMLFGNPGEPGVFPPGGVVPMPPGGFVPPGLPAQPGGIPGAEPMPIEPEPQP